MERGTPEEGGIGPGVDAVVDAVEVLWVDGEGDATFLWLTLPADGKKPEYGTEANIKENIKETSKNPESRNQKPDRHSVPP